MRGVASASRTPATAVASGRSARVAPAGKLRSFVFAGEQKARWLNYDHDADQRRDWFDRTDALRIADSCAEFMAGLRPLNDDDA